MLLYGAELQITINLVKPQYTLANFHRRLKSVTFCQEKQHLKENIFHKLNASNKNKATLIIKTKITFALIFGHMGLINLKTLNFIITMQFFWTNSIKCSSWAFMKGPFTLPSSFQPCHFIDCPFIFSSPTLLLLLTVISRSLKHLSFLVISPVRSRPTPRNKVNKLTVLANCFDLYTTDNSSSSSSGISCFPSLSANVSESSLSLSNSFECKLLVSFSHLKKKNCAHHSWHFSVIPKLQLSWLKQND